MKRMKNPNVSDTVQPDSLFERQMTAWIAVVRTYNECQATLLAGLAPYEVSLLQHEIMMNLMRAPGLTQRELAERCFSAKSGISMLLDRMQNEGLAERRPHPEDSRARCITLTDAGMALARKLAEMQAAVVREMTGHYSDTQLEMLTGLMDDTAERLRQMRAQTA